MHYITPALAETLRWLEAQAPTGEWIIAQGGWGNMLSKRITKLEDRGFIETRAPDDPKGKNNKPREVRVIMPIDAPGVEVVDGNFVTPEVRERLRAMAYKSWRAPVKKGLIRYAGYDSGDRNAW